MGSSERTNYSLFFHQFVASLSGSNDSDSSNLDNCFLQNSNFNDNHNQNQGLSPMILLQTPKENPAGSYILNSFQPEQSLLQNSATDMFASSSNSLKLLKAPVQNLSNSQPGQYLLQNSAKELYGGSDIVNRWQTPAENLGGSQIFNSFEPKHLYAGSDSTAANHFYFPSQPLPNNATESLIENPKEVDLPNRTASKAIDEIFPEKDDYSLSFVYQEGLGYCAKFNKTEKTTCSISKEEKSTSGLSMEKPSSKGINQKAKGSLTIIDLLEQNLPKSSSGMRQQSAQQISQPKGKLQVGTSTTPGYKEITPTYNKATPSLLSAALINTSDQNISGRLATPIPSSVSPPTATRGNGGPLRSRPTRTFPVKLYGEFSHGSSSYKDFNWNMKNKGILSSGAPLYHGASRLSRSSTALDSNSSWQTIRSRYNPGAETHKLQNNLVGSSNVKGVGDQQFSPFFSGLNNQSFQASPSSLSAPKKEPPLAGTQLLANILNSTSQSQITGNGQNQQLEQLQSVLQVPAARQSPENIFTKQVPHQNSTSSFSQRCNIIPIFSANPSFLRGGQKSDYGVNGSSNGAMPSGNSFGWNMANSKLIEAPVTFEHGEWQTKEVDHAIRNLGTKIGTSNLASLKLQEKEFENMVNWPEHHLMGKDRFGFDI